MKPLRGIFLVTYAACMATACGLTVTNERPSYDELDPQEKSAVDIILRELTAFDNQVKQRTAYNIDEVVNREHISVAFEGVIFTGNIGDDIIHVSTWENLSAAQRALVAGWFKTTEVGAEPIYKTLFYQFLAVAQGAKQFMYKVLTPAWVFGHRTLFSVERDSIRTALSHYVAVGRQAEMWGFLSGACAPILSQYGTQYGPNFNKQYLSDHFAELANPDNPTGYMYFICRWVEDSKTETDSLTIELNWLRDLPL